VPLAPFVAAGTFLRGLTGSEHSNRNCLPARRFSGPDGPPFEGLDPAYRVPPRRQSRPA
jgi:hypothetical protein